MNTTQTKETYQNQKARHSKEMDNFKNIFFAFSNKQFTEGMAKFNLTDSKEDIAKVVSIGSGGIVLKTKAKDYVDMIVRFSNESTESLKDDTFMLEALSYELANHEYCITYELDETLDALGIKAEDIKPEILKQAKEYALAEC